ncbi:MAG: serine hydrolase [Dysgonamonadaceae bacterium]|jgi:CubicO group peptidase (beta-lactamase class C family)|nr:serine hydrolase [Dysgonamonadaceae bacterium]
MKNSRLLFILFLVMMYSPVFSQNTGELLQPFIDSGELPGIVTVVATPDKVLGVECLGYQNIGKNKKMDSNSIFWIASQSKPFAGVAVMMLVEEGKLDLDEPITTYLPELKDMQVSRINRKEWQVIELASQPVTLRRLLTHTSGMKWVAGIQNQMGKIDVLPFNISLYATAMTPFVAEPGEKIIYSNQGINIAATVVERVSGMSYADFLQKRLFDPLGMKNTTFWPAGKQLDKLVIPYKLGENGELVETTIGQLQYPLEDKTKRFAEAAGGLFSSPVDLVKFYRMIANKGEFEGKRYLSEASVLEIGKDQTGEKVEGRWGLGWALSDKWMGHGGAYGTESRIYKNGLVAMFFILQQDIPKYKEAFRIFWQEIEKQYGLVESTSGSGKIDRKAVIDRHKLITTVDNPQSPAQVGNGSFAFGADITGLQTFRPHYTLSHWSWHSFPLPEGLRIEDFNGQVWDTHGRPVQYWIGNEEQPELSAWLAGNPHRFNLGRAGFVLKKKNGEVALLSDLKNTRQELDLWTGTLTSRFELDQIPVIVKTICHGDRNAIAVEVESPLFENGQLEVEFSFPYPDKSEQVNSRYDYPDASASKLLYSGKQSAFLERIMDDVLYGVSISWKSKAKLSPAEKPHFFRLVPGKNKKLEFVFEFTRKSEKVSPLTLDECLESSVNEWKKYWESGAAIDLSESKDVRWKELERRIALSQYLMKANEAGNWPPQESGLVNNGWYGRFHFEMIWWHGVHYALWNRWALVDKSLHVYSDFLPTSVERAKKQGYKGARWPKCTAGFDRDWPHPIHATLIWQQPHPIYFAELDYRLHPVQATLDKWKEIVFETAEFMADFAFYDEKTDRYVLGPPVFIVSENTNPKITVNPAYELSYWKFGLRVAQTWKERLLLPREDKWDDVLEKLSSLPVEKGVYVTYEGIPNMWTEYTWEHPGLTGIYGMLPGDGVNLGIFNATLNKVFTVWDFNRTWGWDFPMVAMAAARTGNREIAIDMLLHESKGFQFDEHGLATGGPFPYFPSNGGLLTAVAMMAAGWDGSEGNAPGFPGNGQWVVKQEGFNKLP